MNKTHSKSVPYFDRIGMCSDHSVVAVLYCSLKEILQMCVKSKQHKKK